MFIAAHLIESWLRVTRRPLYQWHVDGNLRRYDADTYESDAFDGFLAACAVNYVNPPTTEEFALGALQLLTPEEAQELLGVDLSYFRFLSRVWLPHLKFPGISGRARYAMREVQALHAAMSQSISATEAGRYLGHTTQRAVVRAVAAGQIVAAPPAPESRKAVHVYWPSFLAHLKERLPTWVTTEQWLEDCHAGYGLVGAAEAAEMLDLDPRSVLQDLEARQGRYVHLHMSGVPQVKVSLAWIAEQMHIEPDFKLGDVARMFGVSLYQVLRWREQGLVACPLVNHPHPPSMPYLQRPCWLAYFRRQCSPGYERAAQHFVDWRRTHEAEALLTLADIAELSGRDIDQLARWAAKGKLLGIRLPDGAWCFERRQAQKLYQR